MQVPSSKVFFKGRFSNGPLWIDYVKHATRMEVNNYAISGGVISATNVSPTLGTSFPKAPVSFAQQVNLYKKDLRQGGGPQGTDIAIVW